MRWSILAGPYLCLLLVPAAGRADIVQLRDGSRHYGDLISQDERQVVFRVAIDASGSGAVRTFAAAEVQSVVRCAERTPPAGDSPADAADRPHSRADCAQMLREGFELLDAGEAEAALAAMQRAVVRAPREALPELSEIARQERGQPLDELLAATRMRVMLRDGRRGFAPPPFVTRVEAGAFGRQLAELTAKTLNKRFGDRELARWATQPETFVDVTPDARRLVDEARLAGSLIAARLRHDPALRRTSAERQRLVKLREDLGRLAAHVAGLPGFTALAAGDAPDDPTLAEARRLAEIDELDRSPASRPAGGASQPSHDRSEEKR